MRLTHVRTLALLLCLPLATGLLGCGSGASPDASPSGAAAARPAFNLDLRATYFPPDTLGAAAQKPGPWHACPPGATSGVVDTEGNPTALEVDIQGGQTSSSGPPETPFGHMVSSEMEGLGGPGDPDLRVLVSGLASGSYDVYYYSVGASTGWTANGVSMNPLDPVSLGWPSRRDVMGPQGTNWDVVTVAVTDGTLTILDTSPSGDGLSGLQIVPVP